MSEAEKKRNERDALCVKGIRKAHGIWDKKCREWTADIARSNKHSNTRGCNFEKALQALKEKAAEIDLQVMGIESKHLAKTSLLDSDITQATALSKELVETINEGNKIRNLLRTWLNAPAHLGEAQVGAQ